MFRLKDLKTVQLVILQNFYIFFWVKDIFYFILYVNKLASQDSKNIIVLYARFGNEFIDKRLKCMTSSIVNSELYDFGQIQRAKSLKIFYQLVTS